MMIINIQLCRNTLFLLAVEYFIDIIDILVFVNYNYIFIIYSSILKERFAENPYVIFNSSQSRKYFRKDIIKNILNPFYIMI